ncbi:MAG: GNAT family N-acetyltransferase [Propionibacteriaceae bacterium]|nr:GNAT family N-acetyltransferase [Propionibacteriaceae bacterium]
MTAGDTLRLALERPDPDDRAVRSAIWAVWGDPRTWTHLPLARPADSAWATGYLAEQARAWRRDGLGWWIVRLRGDGAEPPPGTTPGTGDATGIGDVISTDAVIGMADVAGMGGVIGMGGAALGGTARPAWNLGYRLSPAVWGRGLGAAVAAAGLRAARARRPDIPVTARVLERNPASWRVLEKIGLTRVWRGDAPADDALTSGLARRVYADRPLAADLLAQLIALG